MDRETPWVNAPPPGPAGEQLRALLEDARQVEPWSAAQRARGWWRIADASAVRRRPTRWLVPAGAVLAAAVWIVAGARVAEVRPAPVASLEWAVERLANGDVVRVEPGARWSRDAEGAVAVESGRVELIASRPGAADPLRVSTAHVSFTTSAGRFLVHVENGVTSFNVFEGEVRVRRGEGPELALRPGHALRSDDARLEIRVPAPTPALEAPNTSCDRAVGVAARAACLERESSGTSLAAQTALYALALDEMKRGDDARPRWSDYRARFPDGVFAPEVSLFLMAGHATRGNRPEAVREAELFLRRHGEDPRADDVAEWRDALVDAMKLSDRSGQDEP